MFYLLEQHLREHLVGFLFGIVFVHSMGTLKDTFISFCPFDRHHKGPFFFYILFCLKGFLIHPAGQYILFSLLKDILESTLLTFSTLEGHIIEFEHCRVIEEGTSSRFLHDMGVQVAIFVTFFRASSWGFAPLYILQWISAAATSSCLRHTVCTKPHL